MTSTPRSGAVFGLFLFFFLTLFSLPLWANAANNSEGELAYASLADILEDDQARERLIRELRELSTASAEGQPPLTAAQSDTVQPETQAETTSFARRVANTTQNIAESFVREFSAGIEALRGLFGGGPSIDLSGIIAGAINLLLVVVATVVFFLVLRRLVRPLFGAASAWVLKETGGLLLLRRVVAALAAALLDVIVITLAYIGGYLLALFAIGEVGSMDTRQSLFLNAFLVIELFKTLLRALFAAKDDGLRILPLKAEHAAYWNAWLARLAGFIGYGILLIVPIVNYDVSPALGRMLALLIMALAFVYALVIIWQNKAEVSQQLEQRARASELMFTRLLLSMFAKAWHWLAIAYFAALLVVTINRPEDALPFMLGASLQTMLAIGGGLFLSVLLSHFIRRGFHVNEATRLNFPTLEARLNSFIPTVMKGVRLVIMLIVAGLILDAWAVFSMAEWVSSEMGSRAIGAAVSGAIILLMAMLLWIGLASWIELRLNPDAGSGAPSAREKTLLSIFRNAIAIAIITITTMIVLAEIGINIGPLIAGAGVLGLAIGFGSQKLVQDIITGVFIQLENAVNTGDVVSAGGVTGTAEKLTIRSLGVRDLSGTFHMIPFSSIDTVANYMREFAFHVGEYGVAYREDIDEVIVRLREAFAELTSDPEQKSKILADLEVHGVTALADSSVNIRVRIKTLPGAQWAVGRAYNRLVKYHLDAAGVEIPFPHMTLYFGQDKDGSAPPAPLSIQRHTEPKPVPEVLTQEHSSKTNAKTGEDFDDED